MSRFKKLEKKMGSKKSSTARISIYTVGTLGFLFFIFILYKIIKGVKGGTQHITENVTNPLLMSTLPAVGSGIEKVAETVGSVMSMPGLG
jgi:hypothetical protein